jgi:hypothetical protein
LARTTAKKARPSGRAASCGVSWAQRQRRGGWRPDRRSSVGSDAIRSRRLRAKTTYRTSIFPARKPASHQNSQSPLKRSPPHEAQSNPKRKSLTSDKLIHRPGGRKRAGRERWPPRCRPKTRAVPVFLLVTEQRQAWI